MSRREYRPDGAELSRFLASNAPFACIRGPVESGKTVCAAMRMYVAMQTVKRGDDGVRRSRWLITRDTYPDLEAGPIKTWLDWFPEDLYGRFAWSPPYTHHMRFDDGQGPIEAEVSFEPFTEDDIPKLKSREYTGIWRNEGQFATRRLITTFYERSGRFPTAGKRWVQIDMNAPPDGHWIPMMCGEVPIPDEFTPEERMALEKPPEWEFFIQPPWLIEDKDAQGIVRGYRINPAAENLRILGEDHVMDLLNARTKQEIDADLMNRVSIITSGDPVFRNFRPETHVASTALQHVAGAVIYVGLDFGRRPAAVWAQRIAGQWRILGELTASNTAAVEFAPALRRKLQNLYPGAEFEFWGDPSGASARGETSNETSFQVFEAAGMHVRKADNRGLRKIRIETATRLLEQLAAGGGPAVLLSPACKITITGMSGGYMYQRKKLSGGATYEAEPVKNEYSHPIDAMLEIFMGGGEARVTLGRGERKKAVHTMRNINPFARSGSAWLRRSA